MSSSSAPFRHTLIIEHKQLEFGFVQGRWTDDGTFESLIEANALLLDIENKILERG